MLFLASLFVGPAPITTRSVEVPGATASTANGIAPLGIAQRKTRDPLRALPGSGVPEHARSVVATDPPTTAQGATLFAALLGALLLLVPLVAGFLATGRRTGHTSRRAPGTRRDRAPPAVSFA